MLAQKQGELGTNFRPVRQEAGKKDSMGGLITCLARAAAVSIVLAQLGPAQGVAAEAPQPFATFSTREVDIDIEDGEIEVEASFTLGPASNGIDVVKELLSFQVKGGNASYSVTLPAGSFKMKNSGEFNFLGTINGVKIVASIRQRANAFDFEIVTERANVRGIANPVTVSLTIGDDGGSRTVRAKIE
jgi:hypothetical protein